MRRRTILTALAVILALALLVTGAHAAGRLPPRERETCGIDFYVYGPLLSARAGLRVWINSDEYFATTDADGYARIILPVGQNAAVLRVTEPTAYYPLWSGGAACETPGLFRLEAYVK